VAAASHAARRENKRKVAEEPTEARALAEPLVAMGFVADDAIAALQHCGWDTQAALDQLLSQGSLGGAQAGAAEHGLGDGGQGPSQRDQKEMEADDDAADDEAMEQHDVEMEQDIRGAVGARDAFAQYDVNVLDEGNAIEEYLGYLKCNENDANNG
ncbi:hypothetical protein CYMTET_23095, partial [Cymbomonas tetramitiformis]